MYVMFGEFDFLLRVFDPDRFIRGKGWELKTKEPRVKGVRPRPLTCGKGGELKRINQE